MNETLLEPIAQDPLGWLNALKAALILGVGWVAATLLTRVFRGISEFRLSAHHLSIYSRLLFYAIIALFTVTAIHQLGFKISVLLGTVGILSVAIGFASQTSASNLISGLFLLGEKPFEVGDVLRVEGDTGEVISIDLLSVKLRTFDNLFVRIPNELLIKSKFVNLTKFPIRRIDLAIGIAYGEDLRRVIELLLELANDERRCLEEPQPFCMVTSFANSSVDLQLSIWCRREIVRELKADMLIAMKSLLDSHEIEIPFPHLSIYTGSKTTPLPIKQVSDESSRNQDNSRD